MDNVMWRPVIGYEGFYIVSNYGGVCSIWERRNNVDRPRQHPKRLKQTIGESGYPEVKLCFNGKQRTVRVHVLVAQAFIPNPDCLPFVRHLDDNKLNSRASNLAYGTPLDNTKDRVRNGNTFSGERHPGHKHSDATVQTVRDLYRSGLRQYRIAEKLDLPRSTVSLIVNNKTRTTA